MVVPGNMGWRASAMADAVLEDKVRHAHPIGSTEVTCPSCQKPFPMDCYRIAEGPFGTHKTLHFLCPSCGGIWSADKEDEEKLLAVMKPTSTRPHGFAEDGVLDRRDGGQGD